MLVLQAAMEYWLFDFLHHSLSNESIVRLTFYCIDFSYELRGTEKALLIKVNGFNDTLPVSKMLSYV
jgi:phage-related protein